MLDDFAKLLDAIRHHEQRGVTKRFGLKPFRVPKKVATAGGQQSIGIGASVTLRLATAGQQFGTELAELLDTCREALGDRR